MTEARVAAYVRRSTKDQAQSLERQRHEIERYAAANGVAISTWYEDDGISGVEDAGRPGFQEMVAAAERREFDLILVHEISRFGRFDAFQSGSWLHRLKTARVRVQAIEGVVRDPYSVQGKLMLALEQDRQESVKLSMRTLSGQRETATKGLRAGGKVPYGYARRRRRPDGTVEIVGRFGRAKRDKAEVVELVAGDASEVEVIRSIFSWARNGDGYATIAARLNERGVPSPDAPRRTVAHRPGRWTTATVRALLLNPAYVGDAIWNVRSMPKFHRLQDNQIREVDEFEANTFRLNGRADWVVVKNAHAPLVDRATFDLIRDRVEKRKKGGRQRRHPYLLAGVIQCGNCGSLMCGTMRIRRKASSVAEHEYAYAGYVCSGAGNGGNCRRVAIPRDEFEREVLRVLDEEISSPAGIEHFELALRRALARRATGRNDATVARLEKRERELAEQVSEGAKRLLEVPSELVPEIRDALAGKKAELEGVRTALAAERKRVDEAADPEAVVRETVNEIRSMAEVVHDPANPLERRREMIRRVLVAPPGERPIRVDFDFAAGKGWRSAMTGATVRHLSLRRGGVDFREQEEVGLNVVAGAGFEPATSGL